MRAKLLAASTSENNSKWETPSRLVNIGTFVTVRTQPMFSEWRKASPFVTPVLATTQQPLLPTAKLPPIVPVFRKGRQRPPFLNMTLGSLTFVPLEVPSLEITPLEILSLTLVLGSFETNLVLLVLGRPHSKLVTEITVLTLSTTRTYLLTPTTQAPPYPRKS